MREGETEHADQRLRTRVLAIRSRTKFAENDSRRIARRGKFPGDM